MGRNKLNYEVIKKDDLNRSYDRIKCRCGKETIRSNLSNHKKSEGHKMYIRMFEDKYKCTEDFAYNKKMYE
jgi:hypothetical protein